MKDRDFLERVRNGIDCPRELVENFIPDAKTAIVARLAPKHPTTIHASAMVSELESAPYGCVHGAIMWAAWEMFTEDLLLASLPKWSFPTGHKTTIPPSAPAPKILWSSLLVQSTDKLLGCLNESADSLSRSRNGNSAEKLGKLMLPQAGDKLDLWKMLKDGQGKDKSDRQIAREFNSVRGEKILRQLIAMRGRNEISDWK